MVQGGYGTRDFGGDGTRDVRYGGQYGTGDGRRDVEGTYGTGDGIVQGTLKGTVEGT